MYLKEIADMEWKMMHYFGMVEIMIIVLTEMLPYTI